MRYPPGYMEPETSERLLLKAIVASVRGGEEILGVYGSDDYQIRLKEDQTPVTLADMRSHAVITEILMETGFPVLSEEAADIPFETRRNWTHLWLVDPLDGTKEFIRHNGEFTVNIALIQHQVPVLGVIYIPVQRMLYFSLRSAGSFRTILPEGYSLPGSIPGWINISEKLPLAIRKKGIRIVASRSHASPETAGYINYLRETYGEAEILSCGSSLKICMVAGGQADIYPRLDVTMEWDTAAGQAIAEAAGCSMTRYGTRDPVVYNKKDLKNPWFIVKMPGRLA